MRLRSDVLLFSASFVVISMALGWLFWSVVTPAGAYALETTMLAVPVISAMLASIGFGWRRKLVYAAFTFGLYVFTSLVAEIVGLRETAIQQLAGTGGIPSAGVVLYVAWLTTFPLAMLVLFVGRTPSLLWSKRAD